VGFIEGWTDDQAADITDSSERAGNRGWGTLAAVLRGEGFAPEQVKEGPKEDNTPVPIARMALREYAIIVFGSNNAEYTGEDADSLMAYVNGGGGALFISDGNFGSDWGDAPGSDQIFLDRLGWEMNQDNGTYGVLRGQGDFPAPDHPLLQGVNQFDGEGVSPITVKRYDVPGVKTTLIARAKGQVKRNTAMGGGMLSAATQHDAALVVAEVGKGRIAGHFDRNTFFNRNGAGTSIHRFENRQFAINLVRWLSGQGPVSNGKGPRIRKEGKAPGRSGSIRFDLQGRRLRPSEAGIALAYLAGRP
jgi:hypothetical protein